LPGSESIVAPAEFPKAPAVMVTCDTASIDRLGNLVGRVPKAAEVIWIDHHRSNDGLGTISVVDPAASSTCEMVARLIDKMGGSLSSDSATCLYAGLVTDTGRFQYEAVTPDTLRLAADLRTQPFDHARLVQALYDDNSVGYLRLLGIALQRLTYVEDADLVWTYLTREDLADADVQATDTDDLIDVIRTAREADVAAVFKQQMDGRFKVSTRSRGSTDLSAIAQTFGGGGHRLAAGAGARHQRPAGTERARAPVRQGLRGPPRHHRGRARTVTASGAVVAVVGNSMTSMSLNARSAIVFRSDSIACKSPNRGMSNGACAVVMAWRKARMDSIAAVTACVVSWSAWKLSATPIRSFVSRNASTWRASA
jgi:nanoRNase/pAp phosphatase (c-di-AMP/oligoRNAs hydrolase)